MDQFDMGKEDQGMEYSAIRQKKLFWKQIRFSGQLFCAEKSGRGGTQCERRKIDAEETQKETGEYCGEALLVVYRSGMYGHDPVCACIRGG